MRGSPAGQMNYIFRSSGIFQPGFSRHKLKTSAKAYGAKTPTEIAAMTGIQSFSTYKAYFKTGVELLTFCHQVHGVRSADLLTKDHIRTFLEYKMRSGIKLSSFRRYASGLSKIEVALSHVTGKKCGWFNTIAIMREAASVYLEGTQVARAYENPTSILSYLDGDFLLVAQLQLFSGLRISEATLIEKDQLLGFHIDRSTGQAVGQIRLTRTKGGRPRDVTVPIDVYDQLTSRLDFGNLQVNRSHYRKALMDAVTESKQQHLGRSTHGLRWNYAQNRMLELIHQQPYEVALTTVSHELGHSRASITSHYLRR